MLRLHPRSTRTYTLFPYTTLFRSDEIRLADIVELGFGVVAQRAGDRGERPQAAGCFEEADQLAGHLVVDAVGSQLTVRILQQRRSEEHTSELQSLMRISYAVFCLQKKKTHTTHQCSKSINNT